jgi:hypothetical protein
VIEVVQEVAEVGLEAEEDVVVEGVSEVVVVAVADEVSRRLYMDEDMILYAATRCCVVAWLSVYCLA